MQQSSERLKIELPFDSGILCLHIYSKNWKRVLKRYLHTHVYGISIYNCLNIEAMQIFIAGEMHNQDVSYTYNGI